MTREGPAWLAAFQARFGDVLRTPLDRATGTLTATPERYDPRAVAEVDGSRAGPAERLAVYNRQRWFRFFDVLHGAFPLASRLVGAWEFNAYAAHHLVAHPPRGWDVEGITDDFVASFEELLEREAHADRAALVEAARIDAAFRDVFRAPAVGPFHPSPADAARLLDARLDPSPAVAIVEERRELCALRRWILSHPGEARAALPPLHASPRWVAVARVAAPRGAVGAAYVGEVTVEIPLETREAALLLLLHARSVRDALGEVERACPADERAALPEKTRVWLAQSVARGFWTGLT